MSLPTTPITEASDQTRIALDQTACLASQSDIGQTTIHNICTGAASVVPWGSADWVGFCALVWIGFFILLAFAAIAVMIFRSVVDGY